MLDCAIICGYPVCNDGSISSILQSRIDKGIELYRQGKIKYLIVTGGAVANEYCEAEKMKDYALKQSVDIHHIIVENQAKSTYHNMLYASELMKQYELNSCYIVTNSWHMIKAKYYAKKFHLPYQVMPCHKPRGMSYIKVIVLHIYMPIQMFIMRLKGYK